MLRLTGILLLLYSAAMLGAEDDMQRASEMMRAGNFAEAYCIWRPLAEAGNIDAQFNLGWMYHNGYGLAIDEQKAHDWWRRAAEQNHTDAQFALAMLYAHGSGKIKKDMEQAVSLYIQAARGGHGDASLILRNMIERNDKAVRAVAHRLLTEDWKLLGGALEIQSKRVNVRRSPSLKATIITVLERGHRLVELSRRNKWVHVGITGQGITGWVHASLVQVPASPQP